MDEIPQVQNAQNVQAKNTQPIVQAPIDQPPIEEPPKGTGAIRKIFNAFSWFVFFAFLPVTVLILLSQNAVPGDMFYPIKRSMENVVLAAATVSPATRAAFRTDLTTRRFDEAEKLLLGSSDINGLKEFVTEIQATQDEVSAISNPVKKQELQKKIQTSIIEYEKRLNLVKTQLVMREKNIAVLIPRVEPTSQTVSPSTEPTLAPFPTNTSVPVPTSKPGQPVIPTNTPVPLPTSTPKPTVFPTATPVPQTNVPTRVPTSTSKQTPTLTPMPSFTPTPTPVPEQTGGGETIGNVDKVQEYLRCLKTTPPPHSECIPPEINSKSSSSRAGESEMGNEERSKRDEKQREKKEERESRKEKKNQESHEEKNSNIDN